MKLKRKTMSLYAMAAFYMAAGINHFINPNFYINIMPPWLPWHREMILLSGLAEILLAILLIPYKTQKFAAWGIIVLLIGVFPANIQMVSNYYHQENPLLWLTILRLPIQILLIYWAYQHTSLVRDVKLAKPN
jgi:uncharacterized membrane protein